MAKRAGSAGGFFFPIEDLDIQKTPQSMTPCTQTVDRLASQQSCSNNAKNTSLVLDYLKDGDPTQQKHVSFIYNDVYMMRLTKNAKCKLATMDKATRIRLVAEMKSQLRFMLILVKCELQRPMEIFDSFARAAVCEGGKMPQ
jgi:hypothetical protein